MMSGKSPPSELIFRDDQVEQLFKFFEKEFEKGHNFIIVKILFCLVSSYLF